MDFLKKRISFLENELGKKDIFIELHIIGVY